MMDSKPLITDETEQFAIALTALQLKDTKPRRRKVFGFVFELLRQRDEALARAETAEAEAAALRVELKEAQKAIQEFEDGTWFRRNYLGIWKPEDPAPPQK